MTSTIDARAFQAELQRLDALLREAERQADPAARTRLQEIVEMVLALHGVALERLLGYVEEAGEAGRAALDACSRDDVVGGMLLLHGLHPLDVAARVRLALDAVRPALRAHGGNVALLGVQAGVVRLRLQGSCDGCPSSAVTMKQTIEEAIYGKAPEVTAIEVEAAAESPPAPEAGSPRVALPVL